MLSAPTWKPFGRRAILIEWTAKIDEQILKDIIQFKERIVAHRQELVEDCIIGYHSLTVVYIKEIVDYRTERDALERLYAEKSSENPTPNFLWEVPVCYNAAFGVDLEAIAEKLTLSVEEVIRLHSEAVYTVYFIGFLPGFLYLGGMDPRLEIERKPNPRLRVARGSVAIGGLQTGVYPQDSAGGWNIIGRTPLSFFDVTAPRPCFAQSGDKVQFTAIGRKSFQRLETEVRTGRYQPPKTKLNG